MVSYGEVKEIASIIFGIYSPEETLKKAVCEINSNKLSGPGSIYDERMGAMSSNQICVTCSLDSKNCAGHFGYIKLNRYVAHPLYLRAILSFLKVFCFRCYRPLLTKDHLELLGFLEYSAENRFAKILERIEKIDICQNQNCLSPQPKFLFSPADSTFFISYKTKKETTKIEIMTDEIKKIFDNIPDKDIKLLGFNPKRIHPKNLILSILPVLPPTARPFILTDSLMCDDDLTMQYIEIIKANNRLAEEKSTESQRQKYMQSLKFRIKTLFDNSAAKAKHTNGRAVKGINERLAGKEGLIRSNLMGKRTNQSARSVIGPDPTLRLGELAVPEQIAKILTIPERVCAMNKDRLTILVNSGKANFVLKDNDKIRINLKYALFRKGTELMDGDCIIRDDKILYVEGDDITLREGDKVKRNDEFLPNLKYPQKKNFHLDIGDIVERQLIDGDIVLLNRQPTKLMCYGRNRWLPSRLVRRP